MSIIDIGLALQGARQEKGISIEDAASELHLTVQQMKSLESGEFAGFRGEVFVKGYLRACAKLYGLDGNALIRAYEQTLPRVEPGVDPQKNTAKPVPIVISSPNQPTAFRWLAGVVLVLITAIGCLWWAESHNDNVTVSLVPPPASAVQADSGSQMASDGEPVSILPDDVGVAPVQPAMPVAVGAIKEQLPVDAVASPIAPVVANDAASSLSAASGKVDGQSSVLHLEFSDECWTQIKDGSGKILHAKIHQKGDVVDLNVKPPLYIRFGRASAVNVSYSGVAVSVPIKPGFKTTQFVLGNDMQTSKVEQ